MRPLHDLDNRGAELPPLWSSHATWQDYTAVLGDGELQMIGPTRRTLWPPVHGQIFKLAARAGSRYLAIQTRSAILTWDPACSRAMTPRPARSTRHGRRSTSTMRW